MIIDRQSLRHSRLWIILSAALLLITTAWYFIYARSAPHGPSGGSAPGLVFGSLGTAIIVFAWALAVRKWRRSARWGKTYTWLQGHVYLSLISYPIILYHAGFHWGGALTSILMWAFTACYFSGILLLIMQQIIPKLLLREVTLETIYEQIDHVAWQNLQRADALIADNAVAGNSDSDAGDDEPAGGTALATATRSGAVQLHAFYDTQVRPFLASDIAGQGNPKVLAVWGSTLRRMMFPGKRVAQPLPAVFDEMRRKLTPSQREVIDLLEAWTEEKRQFGLQRKLQRILHGWLLLHVPTAWAMIVLLPIHAVMALRYV